MPINAANTPASCCGNASASAGVAINNNHTLKPNAFYYFFYAFTKCNFIS